MDLNKSYPLSRAEKTYSSKLLRSNKYTLKTKEMTPSSAFPLEDKRGRD
jgi:hypothetical protein